MRVCCDNNRGQALVEFTLCFILLLVIAWIPADFGLMFYTHQLAQNAAREGVRVAAADPTLTIGTTQNCDMPCAAGSEILQQISKRVANGLMSNVNTNIELTTTGTVTACTANVTVTITETYYPFFYKIIRLLLIDTPDTVTLNPVATMRYEHQC